MNKAIKKLAGQTAIYGLSSIIGRLLNYLLVPLYTRIFIPEVYGIVTELYAYVSFLLILLTYGMETGFFRFAQDKSKFNSVYSTILTSLATTSILFVILIQLNLSSISEILRYSEHPEFIMWMALIVSIDAFTSIPFAKLRLQNKAWKFAIFKLINISINIILNLYFYLLCPKLEISNPNSLLLYIYDGNIGVGYVFISNLVANIITLVILLPEILDVKFDFNRKLLKEILSYSWPLLIAGFAGMINETLDRAMLKYLVPLENNPMEQLGIYGANYKLAILMTLFIQMYRYAADPFFFSNKNEENAKDLYALATKYFIICGLIIFLGVMLYLDIIKYFIGSKFHEGLKVVPILLLANLFLGIFYNFSIWYKLNDMTRYGAYLAVFGAAVTIILNLILIPIYGYVGSAWATFICYFLMTLLSYFWGQKYYYVPYKIKNSIIYLVLSLFIYFISILIKLEKLYLNMILNTVLFSGFLFFVYLNERKLLLRIKTKNKNL
ncbi:MAG TPA: oligosaccharide flippase family protein [Bacteroidales bacterium]|nr:oligosaccharide flippase family protein [Bacteroidales bacterium]HOL98184.1 oligosaccharide flippase family protein [Bacteroidales bacterium]HOM36407.1 oligosaccharide flippase family protein [Bacteroidales bacterium]HPD23919.1 oligosaccharide flippase family protein [Bacteroidales bacterium]HRS99990.1 oligosaccharide flippase family protein [Bacteroidales bacterium]